MTGGIAFELSDGTKIPWLAWGNGTGTAKEKAIESGKTALSAGIRHIDTAQSYGTEDATGEVVSQSDLDRGAIYVTSKLSESDGDIPEVPLNKIRERVEETTAKLGFIPDLFLIHNPFVPENGDSVGAWKVLEDMKDEGKLKSIGVSNFRPQDFHALLAAKARYLPVVNQLEYHPFLLTHLAPVLELHEKYGIVTEAYGPLTPLLRHPTKGGPLAPILDRIAARISESTGKPVDAATVLLLWTRAQGVVAVTASGNPDNIKKLAETAELGDLLEKSEIDEITSVGKKYHFRHYREHMEVDFPLPNLPNGA